MSGVELTFVYWRVEQAHAIVHLESWRPLRR